MVQPNPEHVRAVFDEAAERPEGEREAFLREACAGRPDLEAEVRSLLRALDDAGVLDRGPAELGAPVDAGTPAGSEIGGFRIIRPIGRGAMGSVYEAEQDHPRRRVALKVLRALTAGREARRRLVAEADILARLEHPGIARIYTAGTHDLRLSPSGSGTIEDLFGETATVPWIAMELVEDARTLPAYCDERGLGVRERIALFCAVCDAVQFGHAQGVIHRDLKPANILVDGAGRVKVIDFGVARAVSTDPGATLAASIAETHASLVGTLRYMSPEQCEGGAVGTRSDVYALGVVLYELLTARPPYALDERSLAAAALSLRRARPTPPSSTVRSLRGDLETIILKALEREPERRYRSPADLADDLRRFLEHRPIEARPVSAWVRLRKFTRRSPALAATGAIALLALAVGAGGLVIGLSREREARRVAEARRLEADERAYLAAIAAADSAIRVGDGGAAVAHLSGAPAALRGWEWSLLRRRAEQSVAIVTPPGPGFESNRAALSPDGSTIYRGDQDLGRVIALDARTGALRWSVDDVPMEGVFRLSPDGRTLVVSGKSLLAFIDTGAGATRRMELPPAVFAIQADFAPSKGLAAATFATGHGVRVWDLASGVERFSRPTPGGWLFGLGFSSDGERLAVNFDDRSTVVYSTSDWRELTRFSTSRLGPAEWTSARFSPDGTVLAVSTGLDIELHDAGTGARLRTLRGHTQRITDLLFTPDGRRVVSSSYDRTVCVWNVARGERDTLLLGHNATVASLGWTAGDPAPLWSVDEGGVLRRWSLEPGSSPGVFDLDLGPDRVPIFGLSFDRTSNVLLAGANGRTFRWERGSGSMSEVRSDLGHFTAVHADSDIVAQAEPDGFVRVRRASRSSGGGGPGEVLAAFPTPMSSDIKCTLSPDGRRVIIIDPNHGFRMIDVASGRTLAQRTLDAREAAWAGFSGDSRLAAFTHTDGRVVLLDADGRGPDRSVSTSGGVPLAVTLSPTGDLLAIGCNRRRVVVVETAGMTRVCELAGINASVWALAFSPDGQRLAVGSQDRLIRIFDTRSWHELVQLRGHTGTIRTLAWSPDGRTLASGGHDSRVCIWDATPIQPAAIAPRP